MPDLPESVVRLLGEDATSEEVKASAETSARKEALICEHGRWVYDEAKQRKALAWRAWAELLKAAAIELAEATIAEEEDCSCESMTGPCEMHGLRCEAQKKYVAIRDLPRKRSEP